MISGYRKLEIPVIINIKKGLYIQAICPPPQGGGKFWSNLKNREEFYGKLHEKKGYKEKEEE